MVFDCDQCGECCSHLGLVFSIIEARGPYEYLIYNRYTGTRNEVVVGPDKYGLFNDKSIFAELPETCPFFRRHPDTRKAFCTVHLTRPDICREYGCWRLLILDSMGRRAGRIMTGRFMQSENRFLNEIWERYITPLSPLPDREWEDEMIRIVTSVGFQVRK